MTISQSKTSLRPASSAAARHGRIRRVQRGMALMEALVAILIFSFGILGLIGLEASAINFSADSEDRNRAALFANEIASSMWLAGTVNTSSLPLATWNTAITSAATGLTNGALTINPVAGTTNSADIVITWKAANRAAAAQSSQLVTRVILP